MRIRPQTGYGDLAGAIETPSKPPKVRGELETFNMSRMLEVTEDEFALRRGAVMLFLTNRARDVRTRSQHTSSRAHFFQRF